MTTKLQKGVYNLAYRNLNILIYIYNNTITCNGHIKKKNTFLVKLQNIQLLSTIIVITMFFNISNALMTTCDSTQYFVKGTQSLSFSSNSNRRVSERLFYSSYNNVPEQLGSDFTFHPCCIRTFT